MKYHSQIYDDFFDYPLRVKRACDQVPMMDYPASDGVTYPGIIELPERVKNEVHNKLTFLFGHKFSPQLTFGRYSLNEMQPPNWAHSDGNMAQYLALVYLSDTRGDKSQISGTYFLTHEMGFEMHPRTNREKDVLLHDSNNRAVWQKTYYCPSKFNRLFVLSADYIHAAGQSYGTDQLSGRFVISCFFNLEG